MAKNCLIYETLNAVHEMQSVKSSDGLMHLKGVFGVCGVKNNNQRIYETGNYGKMVAEMKERLKSKSILGELEHPSNMNITLENVSHKITDINIDENGVVSGEIVLLNTPKGKIAQAIVEGGASLYISSRASGQVDPRTSVVTLENIATYDLVGSPGFSQAELHLNEGQVAESICESVGIVYDKENEDPKPENQNNENNNQDMTNAEILERLEKLTERVFDLEEENKLLQEALSEVESINKRQLCEGIQRWIIEQFAPTIQEYITEECIPNVQHWVVEQFAPQVQNWIVEHYSPEVQNWCNEEFASGIQNWFINECAPEFEAWINENYSPQITNRINEAVKESKKNSLSNIESTLSMLESIQPAAKPVYKGQTQKTLIVESGAPKYIAEMPAEARVKYDMASTEIKESIERRAKLFDFNKHTVEEFWAGINFENIKPSVNQIQESLTTITNERERAIRAQLMAWNAKRGL
jgi:hypothetical protein